MTPDTAFILAAGHGKRMLPLTERTPKPLVEIKGRPLLDYTLDHLKQAGVKNIVINAHHLAPQIEEWAKTRTTDALQIQYITETVLLETGGGIVNALNHLGNNPFYVIAGDAFWIDPPHQSTLMTLAENWNNDTMDILMMLQNTETMSLTTGIGDYNLDQENRATRSLNQSGQAMFTNIRINHPRIFKDYEPKPFSFLEIMDKAQSQGRLYGLINKGDWHHISTPEDLKNVNNNIQT